MRAGHRSCRYGCDGPPASLSSGVRPVPALPMATPKVPVQPVFRSGGWLMSRRAKRTFVPAFVLAISNFAVFIALDIYLGGDALNGYAREGHYFLCSHGRYTEVARAVWIYSYWHTTSIFVTHGLVFLLAVIFLCTGEMTVEKKRRMA